LAGNSPHQAVRNFIEPLNRAVSCVTKSVLVTTGSDPANQRHAVVLNNGNPVALRSNPALLLTLLMHYKVTEAQGQLGPWKVSTVAYLYSVQDKQGHEFFSYHWHPTSTPQYDFPHLHAHSGILAKIHLPTRRISLEEILRLVITQLNVKPLKREWEKVLRDTQQAHQKFRTWD
jgi:hypothetical protein